MTGEERAIALATPSAHDEAVQAAVLKLVEAFAFKEAEAVLAAHRKRAEEKRWSHTQKLLLDWYELPEEGKPDFLTFAHHRRNPELTG